MEPATRGYDSWIGRDAYDADGDKIGAIIDIYYDDETGRPEWVAVKTGLFGTKRSFVPIHGSSVHRGASGEDGGDLQVAFGKEMVKDAPRIDDDEHLDPDQERELWSYYGYDYGHDTGRGKDFGYGQAYASPRADEDYQWDNQGDAIGDGGTGEAVTRSEEELRVDKQREETGKVRLRKHVVTEQQNIQVPVQKEVARVVREPATGTGGDIGDAETEITLSEERAVVTKETVPKERVRLEKDIVQDTETVSDEVRKEQIELDGDIEDTTTTNRGRQ